MNDMAHTPMISIPPARRFLTDVQVAEILGVHRGWVWRMIRNKTDFPTPIKLSPGVTRWRAEELENWIDMKDAEKSK